MTAREDLSRIADLVASQGTEDDKQAWARLRAERDDLRRRLEAAGETLRAVGMEMPGPYLWACTQCTWTGRESGLFADPAGRCWCPQCRRLDIASGVVRRSIAETEPMR